MIIKTASIEGSDEKTLHFFQRSLIGKLYKKFFKKIPFIRSFVLWGWKRFFPFGFRIYAKLRSEKFIQIPLVKFSEFFGDRKVLYPKQTILTPAPNVFPKYLRHAVVQPHTEYDFPEIFKGLVENCIVVGASNSLSVKEHLIFHDLIDFTHDYTSEELHGRFIVDIEKSLVTRLTLPSVELEIDDGVVFTDAVSRNYAHFLTELLPRMFVFFRDQPQNSGITMIIDAGLHQNLMDAIELVVGTAESMIGLEVGEAALVKSLQVVSPCGYVPFEKRPGKEMLLGHSSGVFSPIALMSMRDFIQKKIAGLALKRTPSRIYIRRNSEYRNVSNAAEIETLLLANGFSIIEPEKLTFLEQVEYFSNADLVVGATGAALANLIFCAPSTRIVILIAKFKHTSYYYWQNMASACGNHVTYVLGEVDSGTGKNIHSNFKVSSKYILEAMSA